MTDTVVLSGARVIVLEDDYYLATDLQHALESAGAIVIGPFPDALDAGLALATEAPDCALVDVNLGDGPSFEFPRALQDHSVPFAFVTGYDRGAIPEEFQQIERLEKPIAAQRCIDLAGRLMARG
ncbi:MAG: hypothetical protein H0V46_04945 [Sphingomonas sp.]|nr:hypothetical protein [Sphingomonas sp.]